MNKNIHIAEIQKQNTKNTLVITGAPRSGTSLLGKLVSTLQGIEYHFEPPMVWVLSSLLSMKAVTPEIASILLQLHLHEDLLVESAHGRKANLRPGDDSMVLNSIRWAELLSRWQVFATGTMQFAQFRRRDCGLHSKRRVLLMRYHFSILPSLNRVS